MQKKIFAFVLFFFTFLQLLPTPAYALIVSPIKPPLPIPIKKTNQTLFGEDQYYTVTFRGNGEAVVTMKAILTNTTDNQLTSISLHIPQNIQATDITAYQVIAQPQCIQYSSDSYVQPNNLQSNSTKCLQYQQPDYEYVPDDTTYQKIEVSQTNDSITLTLPTPLKPNDTGSYMLVYRTFALTHKNLFGAYTFNFASIKVNDPTNTLQIGITTDSDLYLKNAKGTVQYNTPSMAMVALPKTVGSGIQNTQFNNLYNQIGDGTITKTATNLAPLESYTVTGMYADAGIKLYGKEISVTAIAILIFLGVIFGIAVFIFRKRSKKSKEDKSINNNLMMFFLAAGISFVSVSIASGYTIAILLLSIFINTTDYFYQINNIFIFLLISALSGAVYLFFLFVPTIILTVKKGFVWGGITFGLTIMWSLIAMVILIGIAFLFFSSQTTPSPIIRPLMMNGASAGTALPNKAL